ncbi:Tat pathway signal sequence domain protein [Slackia sp. CM382]|uniref:molybdopterin-containing oxidoreductase family protein n=1 Tax=Slackia sp. CM382 TaxID=1111137 RepID=UPI00027C4FD9|nr:molybdopterin-dependent oxidoreductase [Slackia sp. CM382]EJU32199.1 Tat pathway signal sequence domain protein [Slackia sp. CM382]
MSLTTMSRRSFLKSAAVVAGAGALGVAAADDFVASDKAWADDDVQEVRTSCRACIMNCGVIATVSNGRVIKLKGDPIDPMSKGRVCPKGLSGIQALYHPNRNKYPLRRVGGKPGNEWERISWDEAAQEVARAMIDMRDKTGKHGLLCSTGGGGNPQFFSPPRFRNFWGAGNVFEPGCAQCYLPRNYVMPLINGTGDTSIADSGCSELYKPAGRYGQTTQVYVMWGTAPAYNSPATAGRAVAELRANGCKTIVIDPRFTPDASKADIWLPIKPGTDVAMLLGWMNYIIAHKLYERIPGYEDFVAKWTNLPFLVDPRDKVSLPPVAEDITADGQLLRASAVFEDVGADNEGYVYFDEKTGNVTKAFALGPNNEASYNPRLFGTVDVALADGSTITCKTAFQAYADRCAEYDLDTVAGITGCDAGDIKSAIELYCSNAHGGITLGVATDQYPASSQMALGVAALDCMTAHVGHEGCPAVKVGSPGASGISSAESTIFPPGFLGGTAYHFMDDSAVLERLGYVEHKGLGGWMHSHIPTVLSAILTGEPYQPKVWIERSGNKMAALANSSSWVEAFPKFDKIVHCYMYPTSFTTEAADIVFPACEWLENAFMQNRLNVNLFRQPVANLFEAADEIMMWGKIAEAMSDPSSELYDENMEAACNDEIIGSPMVPAYWKTIQDYWDWVATQSGDPRVTDYETAKKYLPEEWATEDEYWGGTVYDTYEKIPSEAGSAANAKKGDLAAAGTQSDDVYTGFSCAARDIADDPKKCGPYGDTMLYIGRHGNESFEMPPAVVDYNPMPYYFTPEDETQYGDEYPLVLTEGRVPFYHHGTLRNNPYLRELYPAPELWISPANAEKYGLTDGAWVNVRSPRTDGKDVFKDISTGLDPETTLAVGKTSGPSEFVPGEELTSDAQSIVSDGIYAIARVTDGIANDSVYMERFWNPEFLEDGSDGRKSWTLENVNVLTKNTGYFNPEFGTYTLRGIRVKVSAAERPEGIWYEANDFEPWMPEPSDFTGGGCYES